MSARRLILWDIDGTLVSTGTIGREALETGAGQAAGLIEIPHISMGGKTDPQIVTEILEAAGLSAAEAVQAVPKALAVAQRHLAASSKRMSCEGFVQPGVPDVLATLATTEGVSQSLLTGNIRPNAKVKLSTFGLDGFFDFDIGAYGSDDAVREALVPIALARAQNLRGVSYGVDEVWIVGDTANDLSCARAGGVRCLLVGTGREGFDAVAELPADQVLPNLSDVDLVCSVLLAQ
ncbi:MAG: HAD family hydrolase [Acidimicrobiales bacterium]